MTIPPEPNTIVRSRSSEQITQLVRVLAQECASLRSMAWFVHGMGGQPKALYQKLPQSVDYEVLATASAMGKWMTAVAPFLAGWAGVIWIRNCSALASLFEMVGEQTMAAIYVVDAAQLDAIVRVAKQQMFEVERAVESDPRHFIYMVDEDSATSDGEVTEIVKWGPQCPASLRKLVHADDT